MIKYDTLGHPIGCNTLSEKNEHKHYLNVCLGYYVLYRKECDGNLVIMDQGDTEQLAYLVIPPNTEYVSEVKLLDSEQLPNQVWGFIEYVVSKFIRKCL